jgi:phasin family protein
MKMTTSKKTADTANPFETMTAINPDTFKAGYEKFAESMAAMADFQKGSLEAMMASANAFAKGAEKLAAEQSEFFKTAYETSVETAKAATSAKSPQESIEINSDYARGAIEKNLGQASKVADLWIETTKQTVEPLTVRYSEMVEKIQSFRP